MSSDKLELSDVWFKNFLTFGDEFQHLHLGGKSLTVIMGENLDAGGEDARNGVAKSALMDIIVYALCNRSLRGIPNKDLVNKIMGKNLFVILEFVRNGNRYRVERGFSPSRCAFYCKPEGCTDDWNKLGPTPNRTKLYELSQKNSADTNKDILAHAGFHDSLVEIILANSSETIPFFKQEEAKRRDIIENLFGIKLLAEKADKIKEKRHLDKLKLVEEETTIAATTKANERIVTQINDMISRSDQWNINHEKSIDAQNLALKPLEKINLSAELEAHTAAKKINDQLITLTHQHRLNEQEKESRKKAYEIAQKQIIDLQAKIKMAESTVALWYENKKKNVNELLTKQVEFAEIDQINVDGITKSITELEEVLAQLQQKHITNLNEVNRLQTEYTVKSMAQMQEKKTNCQTLLSLKKDLENLEKGLVEANNHYQSIRDSKCPTCKQHWNASVNTEKECFERIHEYMGYVKSVEQEIFALENIEYEIIQQPDLSSYPTDETEINNIKNDIGELVFTRSIMIDMLSQKATVNTELTRLNNEANPYTYMLENLKEELARHDIPSFTLDDVPDLSGDISLLSTEKSKILSPCMTLSMEEAERLVVQHRIHETELLRLLEEKNPYIDSVESLKTAIETIDYTQANLLQKRISHADLLMNLLVKSDSFIRKDLVNRYLPILNGQIAKYLHQMESEFRLVFNPDLTCEIKLGNNEYNYGNLSKGERLRLILGLNFSFQDMYEYIYNAINLLFIDELLDAGIDTRGAENATNVIKDIIRQKGKQVFLITHREDIANRADNTIIVRKENQLSTIHK